MIRLFKHAGHIFRSRYCSNVFSFGGRVQFSMWGVHILTQLSSRENCWNFLDVQRANGKQWGTGRFPSRNRWHFCEFITCTKPNLLCPVVSHAWYLPFSCNVGLVTQQWNIQCLRNDVQIIILIISEFFLISMCLWFWTTGMASLKVIRLIVNNRIIAIVSAFVKRKIR